MGITATGVGSGLDIDGLVTKLMEAERLPLERKLLRRESSITSDISGLGSLKGALSDLQNNLGPTNSLSTYQQRNATSSNASAISVAASSSAALGSYSVSVEGLASAQSLAVRNQFNSLSDSVGTGTLTFTFGTTSYTPDDGNPVNTAADTYDGFVAKSGEATKTVTISDANNTLSGVRDAINTANIGVSAAIVSDGGGYRLLLSSVSSGAENSMQISVTDAGDSNDTDASGLSRLAFNSSAGVANVYQTVAAADAAFTVNGLALSSDTNLASDVIDGLALTLNETTTTAASITVSDNTASIKAAINGFVSGYNSFLTTLDGLTGYDSAAGVGGPLQGDFSARSIGNRLRNTLNAAALGFDGTFTRLAEVGVTTSSSGSLSLDDAKLTAALESNFDEVTAVMTRFAQASVGSGLEVNTFPDTVPRGTYAVAVSSLATNGKLEATIPSNAFDITLDSNTDSFVVTVDGTASGTVTLANQAYSNLSAIATEIQTKINADGILRAAGKGVTVTVSGDDIEIRSNSVGSSSSVALANSGSDTTIAALGLALATTAAGTDLVGTIDGVAGTADGNVLTGALGSNAAGLSFNVLSTVGGVITVSDGVVDQIDTLLSGLLGSDNPLDSRINSLQSQADEINEDRAALNTRLEAIELRYRRQFNALDSLLSELSSSGSFIADQLANIPVPGAQKK